MSMGEAYRDLLDELEERLTDLRVTTAEESEMTRPTPKKEVDAANGLLKEAAKKSKQEWITTGMAIFSGLAKAALATQGVPVK